MFVSYSRCIYRIIRISFCDARCNEELFGMKKKKCFVNQLLFKIGTFYLECSGTNVWGETGKNKGNNQKVKYASIPSIGIAAAGIGDFSSNICCEEVCLLRTLQRNVLWSEIINEEIESSLKSNSPLSLLLVLLLCSGVTLKAYALVVVSNCFHTKVRIQQYRRLRPV